MLNASCHEAGPSSSALIVSASLPVLRTGPLLVKIKKVLLYRSSLEIETIKIFLPKHIEETDNSRAEAGWDGKPLSCMSPPTSSRSFRSQTLMISLRSRSRTHLSPNSLIHETLENGSKNGSVRLYAKWCYIKETLVRTGNDF